MSREHGFTKEVRDCMIRRIREDDCQNCPEQLRDTLECEIYEEEVKNEYKQKNN